MMPAVFVRPPFRVPALVALPPFVTSPETVAPAKLENVPALETVPVQVPELPSIPPTLLKPLPIQVAPAWLVTVLTLLRRLPVQVPPEWLVTTPVARLLTSAL